MTRSHRREADSLLMASPSAQLQMGSDPFVTLANMISPRLGDCPSAELRLGQGRTSLACSPIVIDQLNLWLIITHYGVCLGLSPSLPSTKEAAEWCPSEERGARTPSITESISRLRRKLCRDSKLALLGAETSEVRDHVRIHCQRHSQSWPNPPRSRARSG